METLKTICIWIGGIILVLGLACITMPFVMAYPFLYIEYSLNPDSSIPEPCRMEQIISTRPEDIYSLEKKLSEYVTVFPTPRRNEPRFQAYLNQLEKTTSKHISEGKLKSDHINWYHGKNQTHAVKYIYSEWTRSAWARTKSNLGGYFGGVTYYFLLDKDFRILGWLKEEE